MTGDKIKKYRESIGWSQSELARRASITSAAISLIEKGARTPSLAVLKKIANAFNISFLALCSELNYKREDEKLFYAKFSAINKLKTKDQELILKLAERLLK